MDERKTDDKKKKLFTHANRRHRLHVMNWQQRTNDWISERRHASAMQCNEWNLHRIVMLCVCQDCNEERHES